MKMPGFDGTGPRGQGPMTGRGFGPCGSGFRRGFGRGFGRRGRGFGRGFFQRTPFYPLYEEAYEEPIALTKQEEKKVLEAELREVDAEKKEIEKRLKELK